MIFQHTIDNVLNGTKTQTSRIWKGNYVFSSNESDKWMYCVYSSNTSPMRRVYQVNQIHGVQPGRGKKSVAHIKITHLEKRMVHTFTDADIVREGFANRAEFLKVWRAMHGMEQMALVIRFELVQP